MKVAEQIIAFLEQVAQPDSLSIVGLGNPDRADDGFGLDLVKRLKDRFPDRLFSEQENSVEGVVLRLLERKDIDTILFVDAVDFGGKAGELMIFDVEDAGRFVPAVSTHKVPITLLMEIVHRQGKQALLLGVQPESLVFLGKMSSPVGSTLDWLERELDCFLNK